ncbi:hypothetical protein P7K49_005977, partial [Saguinus oedipus]
QGGSLFSLGLRRMERQQQKREQEVHLLGPGSAPATQGNTHPRCGHAQACGNDHAGQVRSKAQRWVGLQTITVTWPHPVREAQTRLEL